MAKTPVSRRQDADSGEAGEMKLGQEPAFETGSRIPSGSQAWRPRAGQGRKHDPGGEIVMRGDLPLNGN